MPDNKHNTIPGLRVKVNPLVPSSASNPADIGGLSGDFRRDYPADAQIFDRMQDAVQNIMRYLRQSPPQVTRIEVDDPSTGQPVAVLGNYVPVTTGVPILNFFSSITMYDDPDPMKASVSITISAGEILITRLSGGAATGDFAVLSPSKISAQFGGNTFEANTQTNFINVNGSAGLNRTVNNPTQLIFNNGICVGATP